MRIAVRCLIIDSYFSHDNFVSLRVILLNCYLFVCRQKTQLLGREEKGSPFPSATFALTNNFWGPGEKNGLSEVRAGTYVHCLLSVHRSIIILCVCVCVYLCFQGNRPLDLPTQQKREDSWNKKKPLPFYLFADNMDGRVRSDAAIFYVSQHISVGYTMKLPLILSIVHFSLWITSYLWL